MKYDNVEILWSFYLTPSCSLLQLSCHVSPSCAKRCLTPGIWSQQTCASVLFIAMNHTFNTMWIKQGEILLSYEVFFYNLKCCSLMPVSHPSIHSALSHLLSPTLTTGLYLPPNNLHILLLLKLFTIPIFLNNFLFPDPPKESHKQVPKCRLILF